LIDTDKLGVDLEFSLAVSGGEVEAATIFDA
jgi:hypothetical protein